jgi:hypothetical protein
MAPASSPPPATTRVRTFIETMLAPPSRATAATYRTRREIPDCEVNPLAALEPAELPFARPHQPDLFAHAARPKPPATAPDDKLARLLAAGTLRPPKPVLKHVARENRRRFLMWVGLAVLTVWLLYSVVR